MIHVYSTHDPAELHASAGAKTGRVSRRSCESARDTLPPVKGFASYLQLVAPSCSRCFRMATGSSAQTRLANVADMAASGEKGVWANALVHPKMKSLSNTVHLNKKDTSRI